MLYYNCGGRTCRRSFENTLKNKTLINGNRTFKELTWNLCKTARILARE